MILLYGIKNCDTIKKARASLEKNQRPYQFWDYRAQGLTAELLDSFCQQLGWQALLNTRGTTYRALPDSDKADMTEQKAKQLMLAQPALIKRPVLLHQGRYLLGFSEASYQDFFTAVAAN
ncbi:ArsC family reductase [Rheinheimera sp.]|uniref:ArsC family reductase n=1 Tax=Rheinheimera sp. TaxID=1869214 RepID=UPI00307F75CE